MTIRIEINVGGDVSDPRAYLDEQMSALGFRRDSEAGLIAYSGSGPHVLAPTPVAETKTDEPAPKKTRAKKDAAPAISTTPEDRRPAEDDAETQAQDEADEAAEVEASRNPERPLTAEDAMQAVGLYVQKFGIPAAQEDGPSIFVAALGKPPGTEPFWKKSLLANATQDQLRKAIDAWTKAAASDQRFKVQ